MSFIILCSPRNLHQLKKVLRLLRVILAMYVK